MRGIPDKLATREDVYNAAMDLPPDKATVFLDGLTPDKVKGLLNAEELAILKANVAVSRGLVQSKEARLAQKHTELYQAESHLADLKVGREKLESQLRALAGQTEDINTNILTLNEPMRDRRTELTEKINAEKNLLPTLDKHLTDLADQLKALAAKKATVEAGRRELEQDLLTHEKDLQAGHSAGTKKKINQAEKELSRCLTLREKLESQLRDLAGQIEDIKAGILTLNEPMRDRRGELKEKINAEKNQLPTLDKHLNDLADQRKALAAKKATVEESSRKLEQDLLTHEKDLQAGHSAAVKKNIEAAEETLAKCHILQGEVTDALIGCNADEKSTSDLIANLKCQIGDLNNG